MNLLSQFVFINLFIIYSQLFRVWQTRNFFIILFIIDVHHIVMTLVIHLKCWFLSLDGINLWAIICWLINFEMLNVIHLFWRNLWPKINDNFVWIFISLNDFCWFFILFMKILSYSSLLSLDKFFLFNRFDLINLFLKWF